MSHYSVAVIHREDQDIDELLAPFSESLEVPHKIEKSKEDLLKEIKEHNTSDKTKEMSDDELIHYWFGYNINENGDIISNSNPDAKWDWYSIGGRFSDLLVSNRGEYCDEGKISELNFSMDLETYNYYLRFWEVVVEDSPLKEGENKDDFRTFFRKEYYLDRYKTKKRFAKEQSNFSTYAILTPEGEWLEPGKMGWFAVSSASNEERREWFDNYMDIIAKYTDHIMTIVDCHI